MGICVSCRRTGLEKRAPFGPKGAAAELLPRLDPIMANSMSNIKMTNPIKGIVSKRRKRYMKDGFNLDLAYITDRLIAMGFPAEKLEGVYRNHIDEVARFLEQMHRDHYKIYNLCSERSYDHSKFHERVVRYAFDDHTPPNIELIIPFCEDVHSWLSADQRNVAVVHCKAGKGRTGTMVCCYMLYSGQKATADEALQFYGNKRTHDEKGVTIPSQRRYVEYYSALVRSGLTYTATKVHIRELIMTPPPMLNGSQCTIEISVTQAQPPLKPPQGCHEIRKHSNQTRVVLNQCTPLCGDVRVCVYTKPKVLMRKEKLFHFWFNTFFVANCVGSVRVPPLADSMNLETFKLTLNKWQLDVAHKDKQNKLYSPDFKVELIVQKQPESSKFSAHGERAPSPPSSSDSSCSEPDTEPDAHWDSGERVYRLLQDPRITHVATEVGSDCHCVDKPRDSCRQDCKISHVMQQVDNSCHKCGVTGDACHCVDKERDQERYRSLQDCKNRHQYCDDSHRHRDKYGDCPLWSSSESSGRHLQDHCHCEPQNSPQSCHKCDPDDDHYDTGMCHCHKDGEECDVEVCQSSNGQSKRTCQIDRACEKRQLVNKCHTRESDEVKLSVNSDTCQGDKCDRTIKSDMKCADLLKDVEVAINKCEDACRSGSYIESNRKPLHANVKLKAEATNSYKDDSEDSMDSLIDETAMESFYGTLQEPCQLRNMTAASPFLYRHEQTKQESTINDPQYLLQKTMSPEICASFSTTHHNQSKHSCVVKENYDRNSSKDNVAKIKPDTIKSGISDINQMKKLELYSRSIATDKDNYLKTSISGAKKYADSFTMKPSGSCEVRPKLGKLKSRSVEDYTTVSAKHTESILTDKDNYTTLCLVKKSNIASYLVCDDPIENLTVCNATLASYVDRFETSDGYPRRRDTSEDDAKMYAEAAKDSSGKDVIRFSETKNVTDIQDVVYRNKPTDPNEDYYFLTGPTSVEGYPSQPEPESSKSKKKSSKRDEEKGKISKVLSDHTIGDDTKKKYTFFQKKDKDEEGGRPRLSLGDMRASWREFSGKWAEHRKKKDRDDS